MIGKNNQRQRMKGIKEDRKDCKNVFKGPDSQGERGRGKSSI